MGRSGTHLIGQIDASVGCKVAIFAGFFELDPLPLVKHKLTIRWVKRLKEQKKVAFRPNFVGRRQNSTINGGVASRLSGSENATNALF
jgi:hypothetical protein